MKEQPGHNFIFLHPYGEYDLKNLAPENFRLCLL